jgi:hypothetical protein
MPAPENLNTCTLVQMRVRTEARVGTVLVSCIHPVLMIVRIHIASTNEKKQIGQSADEIKSERMRISSKISAGARWLALSRVRSLKNLGVYI